MFANGGGASTIGDFQIRDKITGEILVDLSQRPDFINTPGFNPYKILYDDTLEKGPAVLSILQDFQKRDAPKLGPFQADEDTLTNIADIGFGVARATEPAVRGLSRALGEVTGVQGLKDFGGTQEFDPTFSLSPGPVPFTDLFKPSYESYVPTDADRARAQIGLLKAGNVVQEQTKPFLERLRERNREVFGPEGFDIFDYSDDIKELDVVDDASVQKVDAPVTVDLPTGTVEIRNISPDDYEASNIALLKQEMEIVGRDEEGNPLPETRLLQDPEIQDLLDEIKPIELKVDVDKTEADSLMDTELKFEGLKPGELKEGTEEIFESIRPGEDPTKPIAPIMPIGEPAPEKDAVTRKLEEPGFFGSDRFLDFIRNVGGELTRTGQMGAGLALGASKAAEERAARELMAEQEERDFASKLRLARAEAALEGTGFMDPADANKIVDQENALADNIQSFEKSRNTLSNLNKVIGILDAGGATGLRGFFGEATDMIEAAISKDNNGKSFDELEPRTRANSLLKVLRQANVREILGESGKTISNLDRQIVEEVFGDIKLTTPVAVSIKKLEDSRKNILNSMRSTQNKIINSKSFFDNVGYDSNVLRINQPILDLIKAFTFANAESYIAPDTSDAGIIDTTL